MTHTGGDIDGNSTNVTVVTYLDFAGMQAGADRDTKRLNPGGDGLCAPYCTCRAVKRCKYSVAKRFDLSAPEPTELTAS
jgi:hypothetical protein